MICTRNVIIHENSKNTEFGNEPGKASFLEVPDDATSFLPSHQLKDEQVWLNQLLDNNPNAKDILIYIHGYNMSNADVMKRHKILKAGLQRNGWDGELVTFAWPSGTNPVLYWEDRFDAMNVAFELVRSGIKFLVDRINAGCNLNVHVIAHSTGALIARESFYYADKTEGTSKSNWSAGQIVFIAGDVSSKSMHGEQSDPLYNHSKRFTNYFSNHDSILSISDGKRLGFENRVGRVGLPVDSSDHSLDVNCSDYYLQNKTMLDDAMGDDPAKHPHSWYFWSEMFLQDLVYTLKGELDRNAIPTRNPIDNNDFSLKTK